MKHKKGNYFARLARLGNSYGKSRSTITARWKIVCCVFLVVFFRVRAFANFHCRENGQYSV